jgi:chromosome segregation ATPase
MQRHGDALTKCPNCSNHRTDPEPGPCLRTPYRRCVSAQCSGSRANVDVDCPVYRSKFSVPNYGVKQLPINILVEGLSDAQPAASHSSASLSYDGCFDDDEVTITSFSSATTHNASCYQKLCDGCRDNYQEISDGTHDVVALEYEVKALREELAGYKEKLRKQTEEQSIQVDSVRMEYMKNMQECIKKQEEKFTEQTKKYNAQIDEYKNKLQQQALKIQNLMEERDKCKCQLTAISGETESRKWLKDQEEEQSSRRGNFMAKIFRPHKTRPKSAEEPLKTQSETCLTHEKSRKGIQTAGIVNTDTSQF